LLDQVANLRPQLRVDGGRRGEVDRLGQLLLLVDGRLQNAEALIRPDDVVDHGDLPDDALEGPHQLVVVTERPAQGPLSPAPPSLELRANRLELSQLLQPFLEQRHGAVGVHGAAL
jgi:hypothetical protein